MRLLISPMLGALASRRELELVECKGLGHPDSICDAVADAFGALLEREYHDRFGRPLHYNVDKALLRGGVSRPAFGGGQILEPIDLWLAGRATDRYRGVSIPVQEIAHAAAESWFARHLHHLDPKRHLRVHCITRPGSHELIELFDLYAEGSAPLANDTSCGVGFAPTTPLERAVRAVEAAIQSRATQDARPAWGEDVKIMGIRSRGSVQLLIACALIDAFIADRAGYLEECEQLGQLARATAESELGQAPSVEINAADDIERERIFLTVTGTSAEAGDDGEVGRGNRGNGLITPLRPMTMEATSGKNTVSHTGRLYNWLAPRIAQELVEQIPELQAAHCLLVSKIGQPIDRPQLLALELAPHDLAHDRRIQDRAEEIARNGLSGLRAVAWDGLRSHLRASSPR